MDTKLKNSKIICVISGIMVIVAVTAAIGISGFLITYMDMTYIWGDTTKVVEETYSDLWKGEVVAVVVAFVFLAICLWKVGKKNEKGKIELNWFDRIFTDLQIVAFAASILGFVGIILIWNDYSGGMVDQFLTAKQIEEFGGYFASGFEPAWLEAFFAVACSVLLTCLDLLILCSLVKKLKARAFWQYTIIGRIACSLCSAAKASEGVFWKVLLVMMACSILSATWIGIIPVLILIFIFVPKYVRKYQAIKDGVEAVKKGQLDYKIPVTDNGELDRLAMSINQISEATSIAVQNELKNQRLKTDLISNVSHDLKTPLTSMVSYVDLLKTEGLDSENAPEYLNIVEEKTKRLQKLTEDLFEAAKASSGAIAVENTCIEMTSIVNQALAELEEKLSASNLNVIFTNKADEVFVLADGQLLWRVIENLLVNVSKYALAGSRVYLDIVERADMIVLEVKNMSRDQLNISADELMERFKRGDESRNTEGSGLGLAIAKDLTNLMGGIFEISIDGDLFKASVALNKGKTPVSSEEEIA